MTTKIKASNIDSSASQLFGMRNRIINGAMMIDQRNAGASVSLNNTAQYTLDRWYDRCVGGAGSAVISVQQSTTAPTGFINSHQITVTTSKSPAVSEQFWFYQAIEGLNLPDFALGSASALTFTLSFWVRASVTGTYSVAFQNSAQNRSYVSTYTVNSANTWEQKTITVAGDTSGTWLTTNGVGMYVFWDTGSGSNYNTTANAWTAGTYYRTSGSVSLISNSSATFYITGVQLEKGSTATSFEYRPYGTELALCQRYYAKSFSQDVAVGASSTLGMKPICIYYSGVFTWQLGVSFPVDMRAAPSISIYDGGGNANKISYKNNSATIINNITDTGTTATTIGTTGFTGAVGASTTGSYFLHYAASAEL